MRMRDRLNAVREVLGKVRLELRRRLRRGYGASGGVFGWGSERRVIGRQGPTATMFVRSAGNCGAGASDAIAAGLRALAPPPTQQPAPRRGPHAHERPRTQTQADATDRAASTERPHQHTTQSAPRAVRWCRRAGPFETDTRARAGLSVPAPSPSVPHAPQPPSLMVRESAQK